MFTIGSEVFVMFNGELWLCEIVDRCGLEVALRCNDNPDIYRLQKWFRIIDCVEVK